MENGLKKQYGLLMAICMVVGTVVGSGVQSTGDSSKNKW